MRITTKMFYDRFLNDFTSNMEAIFKSQEQISSMKKLNRPSDDPAAMARVVGYKTQVSAIGEYKRAIGSASDSLGNIDTGLSSLNSLIIRAKELALQGADGSSTADERATIAKEIGVMLDSAIDIANTRVGDKYVFAGYKSNVTPIDKQTGEYLSDSSTVEIDINLGTKIGINIPANDLFSFKRNKAADSSTSIMPAFSNDADPNSALYSSKGFFVIGAGNNKVVFGTAGNGTPAGTATLTSGMYTGEQLAAEIESRLETADAAGDYTVTYNETTRKFTIKNDTAADRDLLWRDPNSTAALTLGFRTENAIGISTGTSDISDNATGFTDTSSVFSNNGGTLTIEVGDDDTTPVNITIAAGSDLAEIKDAINAAGAGIKAEVVDMGTGNAHDYRLVVASDPAGRSGDVRITASTNDPAETGLNTLVYMSSADSITIDNTNNKIQIWEDIDGDSVQDAGEFGTAAIAAGSYNADQLASAIKTALQSTTASGNTYDVIYDSSGKKFKIISNAANPHNVNLLWSDVNTTAGTILGFDAVDTANIVPGGSDLSDNALTYGVQLNTFDYNIKNYNYIEDATNSNYYSFNNNYLNGTIDDTGKVQGYILRALNFLKVSLENDDEGRIQKAVDYLDRVADKVFKAQAEVGSRMNKLDAEMEIYENRELDIALYMSDDEDADIAKAASDMAQRQTALQGLRTASAEFMRTSLFDFLR